MLGSCSARQSRQLGLLALNIDVIEETQFHHGSTNKSPHLAKRRVEILFGTAGSIRIVLLEKGLAPVTGLPCRLEVRASAGIWTHLAQC